MPPSLISLLKAASDDRRNLPLADFREAEVRWAVTTGLGPLLLRAIAGGRPALDPSLPLALKAADLTARIETGEKLDAMCEIIDACSGAIPPLVLLKGISTCAQYYSEPHLRSMADVDVLVGDSDIPHAGSLLSSLGFRQHSRKGKELYQTHNHDMPWFHPRNGLWVEVHRALFPPHSRLGKSVVFRCENITAELKLSCFMGRPVMRLSEELQLAYTASHWAQQLNYYGGFFGLLDIIYLLGKTREPLQWDKILGWAQDPIPCAHLYLALSYLQFSGIVDLKPTILNELFKNQRSFGKRSIKLAHVLITRCLMEGRGHQGRIRMRNVEILWKTLLLDRGALQKVLLLPRIFLLPLRARRAVFS